MEKSRQEGGFFSLSLSQLVTSTKAREYQQRRCSQFPGTDKIEICGELSQALDAEGKKKKKMELSYQSVQEASQLFSKDPMC